MKKFLIVLLLSLPGFLFAQDAITLNDCYNDAMQIHPLSGQKNIQFELWQLNDLNLASGWYPTLDAGANILYNSRVTDMNKIIGSLPIPGIPDDIGGMPHDQYKLALDINQVIWDGGAIRNNRVYEEKSRQVSEQDIEIELYKIRESINSTYFGLILLKRQENLLELYLELMESRVKSAESAIENGLLLPGDKSSIVAEQIKLKQQLKESAIKISALCSLLSDLTGKNITAATELLLPDIEIVTDPSINRPELSALDLRIDKLEAGKALIKSNRMPKAFGFATLGYGNPPGNDFFTDEFGTYAIIGAGIRWNIYDWNKSKRNKQKIDLNKTIIVNQKTKLADYFNRALINKYSEIEGLVSMLETDQEIIKLRKSITEASESKFRNGTITSTEYMTILNLEKEARLSSTIHEISLIKSKVEYLNLSGNEIN